MSDDVRYELSGGWALFRTVWLRSAGFPIEHLRALGAPSAAAAVDDGLAIQTKLDQARADAYTALRTHISKVDKAELRELRALMKGLKKQKTLDEDALAGRFARTLKEVNALMAQRTQRRAEAQARYEEARAQEARALVDFVRQERVQEALIWQSRAAFKGTFQALLRRGVERLNSKTREHLRLATKYLQRYVTKNETIGFFGPVGWARIDAAAQPITLEPGPALLRSRHVYFERWAIEALAREISESPQVLPRLAPRVAPSLRLVEDGLIDAHGQKHALPELYRELIAMCVEGTASARQIADRMLEGPFELEEPEEVFELLEQLQQRKLIIWQLDVPVWEPRPERRLRRALRELSETARAQPLQALDALEERRAAVAQAAGDVTALDAAVQALEETFESKTGRSSSRRSGRAYAGRTPFYEDCVRDVDCTLGEVLMDQLSPALELVLTSARWYTHEIARAFERTLEKVWSELAASDDARLDYIAVWRAVEPHLGTPGQSPEAVALARAGLHERWARLLQVEGLDPVHRRADALRQVAAEVFEAPGPGWPHARFHSPDILIAAPSVEAIQAGKHLFVLGEIHVSVNSLLSQVAIAQHPDPAPLLAACREAVGAAFLTPVESAEHATRADFLPVNDQAPQLELGASRSPLPRDSVFAAGALKVWRQDGRLVVGLVDGPSFDLLASLGQHLSFASNSQFWLLERADFVPRVTLDRLVVQRAQWTVSQERLPRVLDGFDAFEAIRAWARALGLPRHIFVKVPSEPKPVHTDLQSPASVDLLARLLKRAEVTHLSEMLPCPEQTWLVDGQGRKYTCELRLCAIDPLQPPHRRQPS